jgi:molecular chaperone DnaJ
MNLHTEMRDPYQALGVSPQASADDIKRAYRKLAKEYHPDRTGGDKAKESRFKEITAAYNILSDPEKRAEFDAMQSSGGIPGGLDLSEIFAQMFGGMGGGHGARVHTYTSTGGTPFGGMGGSPFGGMGGGMGGSPFGGMGGGSPFGGMAGGMGGPQPRSRSQRASAPPKERKIRASDGSALVQRGANIYSELRIPFDQAMQGTVARVPTLTGTAKVKVPPGTSSGLKLRLKGKGASKSNSRKKEHGDHFVTVHIDVPKVNSDASRKLLAKLLKSLSKE